MSGLHGFVGPFVRDLLSSARKPDAEFMAHGQQWRARYSGRYRALALFSLMVFIGLLSIMLLNWESVPRGDLASFCAIFGLYLVASLGTVVEAFRRMILMDDRGLTLHRSLFGPVYLHWDEVEAVWYAKFWQVLKLRGGGTTVWLPLYLSGLRTLRQHLDRYAPGKLTDAARVKIDSTI